MARNGAGTYERAVADYVAGTTIDQSVVNQEMDDIATALTGSIAKNGETTPTANLPMGTYRHTGVGNGSARTDYAAMGQVQDGKVNWVDGGGTADAITATYSPAITALVDGQLCFVRATAANATTTPTFSPNSLTARTIVKNGGVALVAGDIVGDGHELILRYDLTNTRWELLNPGPAAYQPLDADLTAIAALANTDGNFIVGNGSAWVAESGSTARTSLGLGTAAVVNTGVAEGDVPLIDYGTFTPAISFTTPGNLAVVYSNQLGRYIKLGRLIIADIYMTTSTFTHTTASGGLQVTGFPVASENVSVYSSTGSISWQGITKSGYTSIAAVMAANTSTCVFVASGSGVAVSDIAAADMPTGGNVILRFTISYLAAS